MIDNKLVIAVDFDGTIVEESYPEIGKMRKGAAEYIRRLVNEGHIIIINTCRSDSHSMNAKIWCMRNHVVYHYFNENHPDIIEQYNSDSRKISADIYIDDKNLVKLPNWKKKYKLIQKHYQRILKEVEPTPADYLAAEIEVEYEELGLHCEMCACEMNREDYDYCDVCGDCMEGAGGSNIDILI